MSTKTTTEKIADLQRTADNKREFAEMDADDIVKAAEQLIKSLQYDLSGSVDAFTMARNITDTIDTYQRRTKQHWDSVQRQMLEANTLSGVISYLSREN